MIIWILVFSKYKDFTKTVSTLGERVTAVEQSTKQAHKRIDNLGELHLQK